MNNADGVVDHQRYRVMESSEYAPGACWVTGSAKGPFIDTGIYIPKERFGQLVLSKDFIEEAAHRLGLFADIEDKLDEAFEEGYAEAEREKLDGRIDDVLDRLDDLTDALRSVRRDHVVPVEAVEDAGGVDPADVGGLVEGTGDGGPGAGPGDLAAGDEGPAGVSAGGSHEASPFRV